MNYLTAFFGLFTALCGAATYATSMTESSPELNIPDGKITVFSDDIPVNFEDMFLVKHSLGYQIDRIRIVKIHDAAFQSIKAAPVKLQRFCNDKQGMCENFSFSEYIDPKSPAGKNGGTSTKLNQGEYIPAELSLNLFSDVVFNSLAYYRLSLSEQVGVDSKSLSAHVIESLSGYASDIRFDNDKIKSITIRQDKGYFVEPIDALLPEQQYGKGLYAIIEGSKLSEGSRKKLALPGSQPSLDNAQAKLDVKTTK